MFYFILELQQVIYVHLTGTAWINVDCILCMGKTSYLYVVTVFMLYLP